MYTAGKSVKVANGNRDKSNSLSLCPRIWPGAREKTATV